MYLEILMSIKNIPLFFGARLWAALLFCFFGITVVAGDFGGKKNTGSSSGLGKMPRINLFPAEIGIDAKKRKLDENFAVRTNPFVPVVTPVNLEQSLLPTAFLPLPVPSFDTISFRPQAPINSIRQPLKGGRISITREQVSALLNNRFQDLEKIGTGDQGTVFKGRDGEKWYAFKVYENLPAKKTKLDREVGFARLLSDNNHVLKYLEYNHNDDFIYVKTDLFSQDLAQYLEHKSHTSLPEDEIWNYIADIALGLSSFEKRDLVHMDIKPENLFLDKDGRIIIGDLGLVTDLTQLSDDFANFETGDGRFMAPELMNDEVSRACDTASFGFCVLCMATLIELPVEGEAWRLIRQENGADAYLDKCHYSNDLKDLIKLMINPNPDLRPSASEILKQPRVQEILQARNQ